MIRRLLGALAGKLARREESLTVQTALLTAARVLGWLPSIAIPIILVRVFDQRTFGVYKQLLLVLGTAVPILNVGMSASLFYFVPRDDRGGQRYVIQASLVLLCTGILGGLGILLASGLLIDTLSLDVPGAEHYVRILAMLVAVSIPAEIVLSLPIVERRSYLAGSILAGDQLAKGALVIGAAAIFRSLEAVLWAAMILAVGRGLALAAYLGMRSPGASARPERGALARQLRYAAPFALAVLFEIGVQSFHSYYVAGTTSAQLFAIYAVGTVSIPVIGLLQQSVVEVALVRFTEAHDAREYPEMRRTWNVAVARLAVLFLPLWALGELFATDLISFVFGAQYAEAAPVFRVFLLTLPLSLLIDHAVLRATADTGFIFKATVAAFVASVAAVVSLGRLDPLMGGIAGYIIGLAVMRVVGVVKVSRTLRMGWEEVLPWKELAGIGLTCGVALAAAGLAFLLDGGLLRIVAGTVLFGVVFLGVGSRLGTLPRQEVRWLAERFLPGGGR